MDTAEAMAAKSYIDAMAVALRNGGLDAPLGALRVLAMGDLTQGRDPLDRLKTTPAAGSDPAPVPALINLIIPAGTVLGWSAAPSQAGAWGLLDHEESRAVVTAASRHPRTRWCVTLTDQKGEAIAHACARGQHSWAPEDLPGPHGPGGGRDGPGGGRDGPTPEQAARLRDLLRGLNLTFEPIARGSCDHAQAEDRYTPSRKLSHLIRARTALCDAPGCGAQAVFADLDHTVPYPAGPTDECNLGPKCRTHHRCKRGSDWTVEQAQPGVIRWTLPSGRTRTTRPTIYDL